MNKQYNLKIRRLKMRKQYLLSLLLSIILLLFYGCAAYVGTPIIAGLYTGVTAPITYDPGAKGHLYQILGEVEGKSSATSILGIIASGDASVKTAYQNALRQIPDAEDLIDVTVDYKGTSFLALFASYTTIVKAKAVKLKQSKEK